MPDQIAELFLEHSMRKLEQMSAAIAICLERLSEEQIWMHGSKNENAVGNLILHLSGNIIHYIGHAIAGDRDVRDRDLEFAQEKVTARDLQIQLEESVAATTRKLGYITADQLTKRVHTNDGERSILEVIYQVVGHFQQHTGQIIFATKQLTGEDLRIYRPPQS